MMIFKIVTSVIYFCNIIINDEIEDCNNNEVYKCNTLELLWN